MYHILKELHTGKYVILVLDKPISERHYNAYHIEGEFFDVVPLYDMPGCIAIESSDSFIGKTVDLVKR